MVVFQVPSSPLYGGVLPVSSIFTYFVACEFFLPSKAECTDIAPAESPPAIPAKQ